MQKSVATEGLDTNCAQSEFEGVQTTTNLLSKYAYVAESKCVGDQVYN